MSGIPLFILSTYMLVGSCARVKLSVPMRKENTYSLCFDNEHSMFVSILF